MVPKTFLLCSVNYAAIFNFIIKGIGSLWLRNPATHFLQQKKTVKSAAQIFQGKIRALDSLFMFMQAFE